MSARTAQAADVRAPKASEVYADATAASSQRFEVPSAWNGNYVSFQAHGEAIQVLFGDSTVSVTLDADSTVSSEELTVNAATGWEIPADTSVDFRVLDGDTHFAVVAAGTSGRWVARLSNNLAR